MDETNELLKNLALSPFNKNKSEIKLLNSAYQYSKSGKRYCNKSFEDDDDGFISNNKN